MPIRQCPTCGDWFETEDNEQEICDTCPKNGD